MHGGITTFSAFLTVGSAVRDIREDTSYGRLGQQMDDAPENGQAFLCGLVEQLDQNKNLLILA